MSKKERTPKYLKELAQKAQESSRVLTSAIWQFDKDLRKLQTDFFPEASLRDICASFNIETALIRDGEKPSKKKSSPAESKQTAATQTRGRRAVARGDRPILKDAIVVVLGTDDMNCSAILKGLAERGWLPDSKEPHACINRILSSHRNSTFERVRRGYYRVRNPSKTLTSKALYEALTLKGVDRATSHGMANLLNLSANERKSLSGALIGLTSRGLVTKEVGSKPIRWVVQSHPSHTPTAPNPFC